MLRETSILHLPARIGNGNECNAVIAKDEYTDTPMAATTINRIGNRETQEHDDAAESIDYAAVGRIRQQVNDHVRVTFYDTGAASANETEQLQQWAENLEQDPEALKHSSEFIQWSRAAMQSSLTLFHAELKAPLAQAVSSKLISQQSYDKWIRRFQDSSVAYKQKEYWVQYQLPSYIAAWQSAANERKALLANPAMKQLQGNKDVQILKDEHAFLNLHYEKRVDLLAKVRTALAVDSRDKGADVYRKLQTTARGILQAAVAEGVLSSTKVGAWLERIFRSENTPVKIQQFLGGGAGSLQELIGKWRTVRGKYDDIVRRGGSLRNTTIGLYMIPAERFLRMHYNQRKAWVEEADMRIRDAIDIDKEIPEFIRIRHALDLKDWEDAYEMIRGVESANASSSVKMTAENWDRLQSMKRYLGSMRSKNGAKAAEQGEETLQAIEQKIQKEKQGISSEMQPVVDQLLSSSNPNRGIHQLRWIVYNNKWCRDHNFLDYDRSKQGASKESSDATAYRARNGIDTKRRQDQVLNTQNSSQAHMRNNEYAKRRATLTHVDIKHPAGVQTLSTWLEKEQNPRDLYWRTLCINEGGIPMSETWHNNLLANLTSLRSLTQKKEKKQAKATPAESQKKKSAAEGLVSLAA